MNAGRYTEFLTILTPVATENAAGEDEKAYVTLTSLWARPDKASAMEGLKQGVVVGPLKITFIADYIGLARSISDEDRVIWQTNGDMELTVKGVVHMGETDREVHLVCERYIPNDAGTPLLTEAAAIITTESEEIIYA